MAFKQELGAAHLKGDVDQQVPRLPARQQPTNGHRWDPKQCGFLEVMLPFWELAGTKPGPPG